MANEYLNNKIFEKNIIKFQKSKQDKQHYELIIDDLKGMERRKSKSKTLNKRIDEFNESYNNSSKEFKEAQEALAISFLTLSENIIRYAKFNLIDIDDAIQEGVMICFAKIDHFNPIKGKAFNYMTTCILNHYRQLYRYARNYNTLKLKYQEYLINHLEKVLIHRAKIK